MPRLLIILFLWFLLMVRSWLLSARIKQFLLWVPVMHVAVLSLTKTPVKGMGSIKYKPTEFTLFPVIESPEQHDETHNE